MNTDYFAALVAPKSNEGGNSASQPPFAPLLSAADRMGKADPQKSEIVLYQTEDGRTRLEVKLENETVWLTQGQLAELFQTTQQNISLHLQNLYEEGELTAEATHKEFLSVRREGSRNIRRRLDSYNLDVIISVGYRVKSLRGTQFRIWATQRLREFIVKGFTLDDERLKEGGGAYFDELLARIREIRAAERNFYQKIKDIYATSADYDEAAEITQDFFAMAQNKLHWARAHQCQLRSSLNRSLKLRRSRP
jgi:hypothetical protein